MSKKDRWLINYSQCWEDAGVLIKALGIVPADSVLSITSGGDNTLALISLSPARLIAIDNNRYQNYLFKLKLEAIRSIDPLTLFAFIGLENNKDRVSLYKEIAPALDNNSRSFWDKNTDLINKGLIHTGKFESYLNYFRKYFLGLLYSKKVIAGLLEEKTVDQQTEYYNTAWDKRIWRFLFRIFFSKQIMSRYGRGEGMFDFNKSKSVGDHYLEKTKAALSGRIVFYNSYMDYLLTGSYATNLPPYLEKENISRIRSSKSKIETKDSSLIDYLGTSDDNSISKFNLSDIFEKMTPDETADVFSEIIRVGKKNARIIFWNNMVRRDVPVNLSQYLRREEKLEEELRQRDKVFFYDSFKIYSIKK